MTPVLTGDARDARSVDPAVVREKVWPLLLRLRSSPQVRVRTATLITLGRVGAVAPDLAAEARAILLEATGDRDHRVARAAVRGLLHVGEPAFVPSLHRAASSSTRADDVRGFLTLALPSLASRSADALLSSLWKGDEGGEVELAVLAALAHAHGPAGDAVLRSAAFDADVRPELRATALWALARRGVDDAADLLSKALADRKDAIRRAAVLGFGVLEWRTPAEAEIAALREEARLEGRLSRSLSDRLRLLGPLVEAQVGPRDESARAAVRRLGRVLAWDRDRFTRSMAAVSLGRIARQVESPFAVTLLERELARDRHAQREFALLGLALARAPSAHAAAVALLERETAAPTTRGAAAVALGLLGDSAADKALRTALAREPHPTVRGYVAVALGMIGSAASAGPLHEFFASAASPDAVGWGGVAVALMGRRHDTSILVRRLSEAKSDEVGWNLVHAVRMSGDRAALEGLLAVAATPKPSVQELGVLALGYVVAPEAYPPSLRMSRGYDYTLRTRTLDAFYFAL